MTLTLTSTGVVTSPTSARLLSYHQVIPSAPPLMDLLTKIHSRNLDYTTQPRTGRGGPSPCDLQIYNGIKRISRSSKTRTTFRDQCQAQRKGPRGQRRSGFEGTGQTPCLTASSSRQTGTILIACSSPSVFLLAPRTTSLPFCFMSTCNDA
jgi:hypothetical protein